MSAARTGLAFTAKVATVIAAFAIGISVALPSQAASGTYDRDVAVAYAKQFTCNGDDCSNPAFRRLASDCTNFVSQAMAYGGKKMVTSGTQVWYQSGGGFTTWTPSWYNVGSMRSFLLQSGKNRASVTTTYTSTLLKTAYTSASAGDLIIYDWGHGTASWDHLAMVTGFGTYASPYKGMGTGKGDKIAQHSTDRDGAPWNYGYLTETDGTVRPKMKAAVLHLSPGG